MSKDLASAAAVGAQLHIEGHWPPNDLSKVMQTDYHYDQNSMPLFLTAVQTRLAKGTPPYVFTFDAKFIATALTSMVGVLMGNVSKNTTNPASGAESKPKTKAGRK